MTETAFKRGDIIISKKGTRPARLTYNFSYGREWNAQYLHNGKFTVFHEDNIELYDEQTMTQSQSLWQFKSESGNVVYGIHLAETQNNMWVMEEKGTGKIHTINKNEAEEVLPYTFSVNRGGQVYNYLGVKDQVSVGDVLVHVADKPEISIVTAINTKSKTARTHFKGYKLTTQPITTQS